MGRVLVVASFVEFCWFLEVFFYFVFIWYFPLAFLYNETDGKIDDEMKRS